MGASKTTQYSTEEIKSANIARALAHPARIRILSLLKQDSVIRNIDIVKDLHLVKSTVHSHLNKLKDADLIELEFYSNCYWVRSKKDVLDRIPSCFE